MQLFEHGRLFLTLHRLRRVFLEGFRDSVGVPSLEEDDVFGFAAVLPDFLYGIVHTVLPGNPVECFDVGIGAFDGGHALVLSDELFDCLLSMGNHILSGGLFVFAVGEKFADRRLEHPSGQLSGADG